MENIKALSKRPAHRDGEDPLPAPHAKRTRIDAPSENEALSPSLAWFLGSESKGGVSGAEFFRDNFEKKPLVVRAKNDDDANRAHKLFSYEKMLEYISKNEVSYNDDMCICTFKDKKKQIAELEGVADSKRVDDLYTKHNHTLQFYRPQRFSDSLWSFNHDLENDFQDLCGASAYLTPPNSQRHT